MRRRVRHQEHVEILWKILEWILVHRRMSTKPFSRWTLRRPNGRNSTEVYILHNCFWSLRVKFRKILSPLNLAAVHSRYKLPLFLQHLSCYRAVTLYAKILKLSIRSHNQSRNVSLSLELRIKNDFAMERQPLSNVVWDPGFRKLGSNEMVDLKTKSSNKDTVLNRWKATHVSHNSQSFRTILY